MCFWGFVLWFYCLITLTRLVNVDVEAVWACAHEHIRVFVALLGKHTAVKGQGKENLVKALLEACKVIFLVLAVVPFEVVQLRTHNNPALPIQSEEHLRQRLLI